MAIQQKRFEHRFNIATGLDEAQERFINRLFNKIDENFLGFTEKNCSLQEYVRVFKFVATKLGIRYEGQNFLTYYCNHDFIQVLKTIEALYEAFTLHPYARSKENLDAIITSTISESETDLEIEWREGLFYRTGAKLLDEGLVNEELKWLADQKYSNVLQPFQKGLGLYLEAVRDTSRYSDTITDLYEALEALAKIVCANDRELSGNKELFIKKIKLGKHYATMLSVYIDYANEYRHAINQGKIRSTPTANEVEAFIYTTGLFIRLAIKQIN